MSSPVENTAESESWIKGQTVIYGGITWGVLSLALFLSGIFLPDLEDSMVYLVGTYIAEYVPFIAGVALCYRNWRSPKIASGRNVWLGIGLGILSYFIADLIFGIWEIYWGLDPEISPADFFYIAFYLCVGGGMVLAVFSRRLNLELWQWVTLSIIAIAGSALAIWIALAEPAASAEILASPITSDLAAEEGLTRIPPEWLMSLQDFLLQFSKPVNFFYIICDVALLIVAAMLLLAFWGGTFSQSWRMIAAAAFAKYLADMWFKYAATLPTEYASGGFLEVFFVFSGILFAIGAALEYDISSRPRKSRRRRANSSGEVA
ncbi:hypothetical protein [Spirulina subsalsa]|uniref:hypothetical protein n=1 Tax=Spirulina subsalsa TaxID=54311 RepID=UPI0002EE9C6C|nr:hypothetical protein [Spirulina subsalsa]